MAKWAAALKLPWASVLPASIACCFVSPAEPKANNPGVKGGASIAGAMLKIPVKTFLVHSGEVMGACAASAPVLVSAMRALSSKGWT